MNKTHPKTGTALAVLLLFFSASLVSPVMTFSQDKTAAQTVEKTGGDKTAAGEKTSTGPEEKTEPEKKEEAPKKAEDEGTVHSLWALFKKGGPFMWPILLMAAFGLAFIIERYIHFARAKLSSREFMDQISRTIATGDMKAVEDLCESKDNKISRIITKGLQLKNLGYERVEKTFSVVASIEIASLERGLSVLSALGNIVPMLGFLGTVSGMINAFSEIAKADQVKASLVAGGIQEALLTTAAGLIVAIPTLIFYNYFVHRIDIFIADVEKVSTDVVENLVKKAGSSGEQVA
jgi:biopolymer transport protein ExbB